MCDNDERCALKTDVFTLAWRWATGQRPKLKPAPRDALDAWKRMMEDEKRAGAEKDAVTAVVTAVAKGDDAR